MENDPLTFEEKQDHAFDNYRNRRDKLANTLRKTANKSSFHDNMVACLVGGAVFGALMAIMLGRANSDVPVRDAKGRIVEYKYDGHRMTRTMLATLAIAMLLAAATLGIEDLKANYRNKKQGLILADDMFDKSFEKALKTYLPEVNAPFRAIVARVLIMNNMSYSELKALRSIATSAAVQYNEETGHYDISEKAIDEASKIIENFVNSHIDVGTNVIRIMHGERPTDYYLQLHENQR
ncbi:MAG: hypothetical protein J6W40_02595 [Alphaproteobacteria bacterium]|nr:hypothetical protein [Alphaproteobacteria bacterium]